MSCIVAVHQDGVTAIGADSRTTGGGIYPSECMKWVVTSRGAVGVVGWNRTMQDLRLNPELIADTADETALALERFLQAAGHQTPRQRAEGGPVGWDSSFIYASKSGVWDIDGSLCVSKIEDGTLWARGSGLDYAVGAGHALRNLRLPEQRCRAALEAAVKFDNGCGEPIWVKML